MEVSMYSLISTQNQLDLIDNSYRLFFQKNYLLLFFVLYIDSKNLRLKTFLNLIEKKALKLSVQSLALSIKIRVVRFTNPNSIHRGLHFILRGPHYWDFGSTILYLNSFSWFRSHNLPSQKIERISLKKLNNTDSFE